MRSALITGGAKRIGAEIALTLAKMGFNIALHYNHSKSCAENLKSEISALGVQCELFQCDLENEEETSGLIAQVQKTFNSLELLVNNASIFEKTDLTDGGIDSFNRHVAINLKAPFILMSYFEKLCKKGHIINLLDANITKSSTQYLVYLLTKKSLAELTKLTAIKFAPSIRVNGIAPGLVMPAEHEDDQLIDSLTQKIPLKRQACIESMNQSLRFLIENDYLTGQIIYNDGGWHLNG